MRWPILLGALLILPGCVRRQIDITSTPSGALVRVNDREVGRTPCQIEFDHYGVYEVRLALEGYESVVGMGRAEAPVWDWVGLDLVSELAPWTSVSRTAWHFELVPDRTDPESLVERARALRSDLAVIERDLPVDRTAIMTAPSVEAAAREDGERGVVPTPPSVLPPAPVTAPAGGAPSAP